MTTSRHWQTLSEKYASNQNHTLQHLEKTDLKKKRAVNWKQRETIEVIIFEYIFAGPPKIAFRLQIL